MKNSRIPSMPIRSIIVLCLLFPCAAVTLADDAAVPRRANDSQIATPSSQAGHEKQTKSAVKPNTTEANPNYILQVVNLHYIRAKPRFPSSGTFLWRRGATPGCGPDSRSMKSEIV